MSQRCGGPVTAQSWKQVIERMGDVEVIIESGTGMLRTESWQAFAASAGTPFHTARFLLAWWQDRLAKNPASRLITAKVVDEDRVVGICAFELDGDRLSFAGGGDVVDYLGPAAATGREKEVAAALSRWMFEEPGWRRASLAGLVHNDAAAQAIIDEVLRIAPDAVVEPYDQAPRIEQAPQGYLALLNSKRRADILRKRNRLIEAVGELELVVSTPETVAESLERLLAWKAEAGPATRGFVAEYGGFVRTLVAELAAVDAAHVVELHAAGRPLASAIMLAHGKTAFIYNMSYDMNLATEDRAGLAPGVVLVSLLVERNLDNGLRFDFLKGAQDYKLRLGGVPVDLIAVRIER
jgi:CelD/BcsL family acetyltransferase involved in cellulose biosynthesis